MKLPHGWDTEKCDKLLSSISEIIDSSAQCALFCGAMCSSVFRQEDVLEKALFARPPSEILLRLRPELLEIESCLILSVGGTASDIPQAWWGTQKFAGSCHYSLAVDLAESFWLLDERGFRETLMLRSRKMLQDRFEGFREIAGTLSPKLIREKAIFLECTRQTSISGNEPVQYVTLDQMAAIVGRSKRTLERWVTDGKIPDPDIDGGGGKPNEWKWSKVKLSLEKECEKILPDQYPTLRE